MTDILQQTFLDRIEPEIAQFEANAALWRLEAGQRRYRLTEERALGANPKDAAEEAAVALEGIRFEIEDCEDGRWTTQASPKQLL